MSTPDDPNARSVQPDKPAIDTTASTITPIDVSRGSRSRRNIRIALIVLIAAPIVAVVIHVITRVG